MTDSTPFPRLVSLACHDLRTPLAAVLGFARTLPRVTTLDEPAARYVRIIEDAASEMAELLDELGVVARIEGGRYEPALAQSSTLDLARAAAARVPDGRASCEGTGADVAVEPGATERALAALAGCALRHGELEHVTLVAGGASIEIRPVPAQAAPVLLGVEARDFGAAVARRVVEALDGGLEIRGDALVVRLPRYDAPA